LSAPAPGIRPLSTLEQDARLLGEADIAMRSGDADRALALLAEHAATFPSSELEPERSAERIFALCRAGRVEEAWSETSAFVRAHPTGPLSARVKGACGAAGE
jgi:outer membrane protein assembly factor BamD (BamD/ComL family)